jgi:mannose/fructose-specific phosphotransferase system component IIA
MTDINQLQATHKHLNESTAVRSGGYSLPMVLPAGGARRLAEQRHLATSQAAATSAGHFILQKKEKKKK